MLRSWLRLWSYMVLTSCLPILHGSEHAGSHYQPEAGRLSQCLFDSPPSPLLICIRTKYPRQSPAASPWRAASHEDVTGMSLSFFF